MDIGPINIYHSRVSAQEGQAALLALDAGQAEGMRVVVRPRDGEHFRLYRPDVPDIHSPLLLNLIE